MLKIKLEKDPRGLLVKQLKNPISGARMNKFAVKGSLYIPVNNPNYEIYNLLLLKDGYPIADCIGNYKYKVPPKFIRQYATARGKIIAVNYRIEGNSLKLYHAKSKLSVNEVEALLVDYKELLVGYIAGKHSTKPDVQEFIRNKFPNHD